MKPFTAQDLRVDPNNLGGAHPITKGLIIGVVCLVLAAGWVYLDTSEQRMQLESAENKENSLRNEFAEKQRKAANLNAYRQQMEQMQEAFKDLLRQLPKSTEVPGLVDEVSYAASGSGLFSGRLEMQQDVKKQFYIETPIKVSVTGSYHQIGEFISKVSALPRIVTIHDFTIKTNAKAGDIDNSDNLTMELTAKTYRYEAEGGK
ncbi:type 4a pilus biogenesis protein PilO [Permianibacter aggregans]|uniref:Type IV pilus assembly protein PilO n=1 Tax=Permianibacter aggregans TaxID=1510150 RepID=A0A4R6UUH1_9GAMM|nr:type 4a pilus biogenesis protein PilO [Permianibacter aggregans]QGX40437.1 pilus assembly protein PilO [Permianibacter aggregans]TDQ49423.1 type IV pilus assembly protein PilO [Permianibacter aggregans]